MLERAVFNILIGIPFYYLVWVSLESLVTPPDPAGLFSEGGEVIKIHIVVSIRTPEAGSQCIRRVCVSRLRKASCGQSTGYE